MESKANPVGFVAAVIARVKTDTAFRAVMSRADNPALESSAWEYLIPYCNIENDLERIPFAMVGAAIARIRPENDGNAGIGTAFRSICHNDEDRERESARFRRLIACDSSLELCPVLRPVIQYLASNGASVNFTQLLKDLLYWNQRTKIRWTTHFYDRNTQENEEANA
ncbi:MAG: type I-E CRISPR-associated protein Cse2/CasB [Lentisphaeria bacterium]|nr:type I-E CRISPR-associated protein Cse2/CasB [Lentisphaeria bacterium]